MSFTRRSHMATVEYNVLDEEWMDSLLGPDAKMDPFQARVEFVDGELSEVIVFGWRVGANGRIGKSSSARRFRPDDLTDAPAWVQNLAISATFGGKQ